MATITIENVLDLLYITPQDDTTKHEKLVRTGVNIIAQSDEKLYRPICARLGCKRTSNCIGHGCFCSGACYKYVLERVGGAGILLVGKKSGSPYMILGADHNEYEKYGYEVFAGKLEPNETPYQCAIRELEEESGMKILNKESLYNLLKISPTTIKPTMVKGGIFDKEKSKYFMLMAVNLESLVFDPLAMHIAWKVRLAKYTEQKEYSRDWTDIDRAALFKFDYPKDKKIETLEGDKLKVCDRDNWFLSQHHFMVNTRTLIESNCAGLKTYSIWNGDFHH